MYWLSIRIVVTYIVLCYIAISSLFPNLPLLFAPPHLVLTTSKNPEQSVSRLIKSRTFSYSRLSRVTRAALFPELVQCPTEFLHYETLRPPPMKRKAPVYSQSTGIDRWWGERHEPREQSPSLASPPPTPFPGWPPGCWQSAWVLRNALCLPLEFQRLRQANKVRVAFCGDWCRHQWYILSARGMSEGRRRGGGGGGGEGC